LPLFVEFPGAVLGWWCAIRKV